MNLLKSFENALNAVDSAAANTIGEEGGVQEIQEKVQSIGNALVSPVKILGTAKKAPTPIRVQPKVNDEDIFKFLDDDSDDDLIVPSKPKIQPKKKPIVTKFKPKANPKQMPKVFGSKTPVIKNSPKKTPIPIIESTSSSEESSNQSSNAEKQNEDILITSETQQKEIQEPEEINDNIELKKPQILENKSLSESEETEEISPEVQNSSSSVEEIQNTEENITPNKSNNPTIAENLVSQEKESEENITEEIEEDNEEDVEEDQSEEETMRKQEYDELVGINAKLQRQNQLCKTEIRKLNEEIISVAEKISSLQQERESTSRNLENTQKEVFEKERQIKKISLEKNDIDAQLGAKLNQIEQILIKNEELKKTLENSESTVISLKENLSKVLQDKDSLNTNQEQITQYWESKYQELEKFIQTEKENNKNLQKEKSKRESELELNITEMTNALGNTQRNLDDKLIEIQRYEARTKTLQNDVQLAKQETNDYKLQVRQILQDKEKTITDLRKHINDPNSNENTEIESGDELLLVQMERDNLREELTENKVQYDKLQRKLLDTQNQIESNKEATNSQFQLIELDLENEKKKVNQLNYDLVNQAQETNQIKEEYESKILKLQQRINQKEKEMTSFQKQIKAKSLSSVSQSELEFKLKQTTDQLMEKQKILDQISAEKSVLSLQIESHDKEALNNANNDINLDINDDSDRNRGPRLRSIASLVPPQTAEQPLGRSFVKAARAVDSVSLETGNLLRMNPIARLLAFFYVIILHLWVFYIIIYFQHEVHEKNTVHSILPPKILNPADSG